MRIQTQSVTRMLPLRLPRVCVALVATDPAELFQKAEAVVRENAFLELRLDYLKDPAAAIPRLRKFAEAHPSAVMIATCRRSGNGGHFKGSITSQLEVLLKAAGAGAQIIDIEIESAQAMKPAERDKVRSKTALLVSFHDFKATKNLEETFEKMLAIPADYYKVVSTATTLYDNVAMMKFLQQKSDQYSVVGLCMGEQGIISRVLGLRAGSAFTFASAATGEETAPGQITARELRELYRIDQVDAATKVYGVAGDPVAHSLSPQMLNAAFRRENLNAIYLPLHVKTVDDLLSCVRDIPIHGISVTMPYKKDIVAHLSNSDTLTQRSGACNTVVRGQDGRLFGFNTDVSGIVTPLQQRMTLTRAKILVIGAGGAARAAVVGLKDRGADVYIINRTPARGQKLAKETESNYLKRSDLKKYVFDVIINATPLGMESQESPLSEKEIKARYVFDLVYTAEETPFLQAGKASGAQIIPGYEMFVHQGARQFEIWTGKPAPQPEMQNVVTAALAARKLSQNGNRRPGSSPDTGQRGAEKAHAVRARTAK